MAWEPPRSDGIEIDIVVDRHRFEPPLIERHVEDRLLLLRVEAAREIGAEFFHQQRNAVGAPALVADRIFDDDFRKDAFRP